MEHFIIKSNNTCFIAKILVILHSQMFACLKYNNTSEHNKQQIYKRNGQKAIRILACVETG